MKDSDVPELNYAWWKKNQPVTLPATGLGAALRAFEDAREKAVPTQDVTSIPDRLDLYADAIEKLDALGPAVGKGRSRQPVGQEFRCRGQEGREDIGWHRERGQGGDAAEMRSIQGRSVQLVLQSFGYLQ